MCGSFDLVGFEVGVVEELVGDGSVQGSFGGTGALGGTECGLGSEDSDFPELGGFGPESAGEVRDGGSEGGRGEGFWGGGDGLKACEDILEGSFFFGGLEDVRDFLSVFFGFGGQEAFKVALASSNFLSEGVFGPEAFGEHSEPGCDALESLEAKVFGFFLVCEQFWEPGFCHERGWGFFGLFSIFFIDN